MKEQLDIDNGDLSDDKDEKPDCHDLKPSIEFDMVELKWNKYNDGEVVKSSTLEDKPDSVKEIGYMRPNNNGHEEMQPFEAEANMNASDEDFESRLYTSVYNN